MRNKDIEMDEDFKNMSKREQLEAKANQGNVTAMQMLEKMDFEAKIEAKKRELLDSAVYQRPDDNSGLMEGLNGVPVLPSSRNIGEMMKDLDITEIEVYIRRGEFKSLPAHMATYLKWMELAHDWYYKFRDKNWIVNYLMANCKDEEGNQISRYLANKVFGDMLSFYYSDQDFKKNTWFLYLAERLMIGAALAFEMNDFKTYKDCIDKAAGVIDKITIEKQNIDPRLLERRPRFFLTDAAQLGLPPIDRNALARTIDEMVVPEKVKMRVKQDLGIEKRDLTEETLGDELEETK